MLPPGLHSQQAGTILPTLMPIPPATPPRGDARWAWTINFGRLDLGAHVLREAAKQAGEPRIPLVPVMTSRDSVELVPKVTPLEQRREFAVCRQQAFLFATGQKKIWRSFGIRGPDQSKGIVFSTRRAASGPKNRVVMAGLLQSLDGKRAARNVDGGT